MNTMLRVIALSAGLAGALSVSSATAATANDTFRVSITIENACTIVANDLNFGTVNTLAAAVNGASTVLVSCTGIGPLSIAFNAGTGTGSTLAQRRMNLGADTINYNLYTTAGATVVLGDGTGGTAVLSGNSTGNANDSFNVFGRVAAGQNPKPLGTYTSDVVATVTF